MSEQEEIDNGIKKCEELLVDLDDDIGRQWETVYQGFERLRELRGQRAELLTTLCKFRLADVRKERKGC